MRWELEETRNHVERLFGRQQLELARPCIRSVVDRQTYAQVHYEHARARIDAYAQSALQSASLLEVTLGGTEAWQGFNAFIREVAAHLTACVQSMHAVPDILSNALYFSLALDQGATALKPRNVNVANTLKLLRGNEEFSELANHLNELVTGGHFLHLAALANQAKHRSIVFPSLNEDLTGERADRHLVLFPAFAYEDNMYPQVVAHSMLEAEYERCSKIVIVTGVTLNALLQRRVP